MNAKERAADAALAHVRPGMILGLGTGSTARIFIDLLAKQVQAGALPGLCGVPTSLASETQARAAGIKIVDLSQVERCDLTIDGADEIDPQLNLIKGLGGALLREKIVAQNSRRLIIIADESKLVPHLGARTPLPVEAVRFAWQSTERYLRTLGCTPTLRQNEAGQTFNTDNGNVIFDCRFDRIDDPAAMDVRLKTCAGVVETGLFTGIASLALVGSDDGVREMTK